MASSWLYGGGGGGGGFRLRERMDGKNKNKNSEAIGGSRKPIFVLYLRDVDFLDSSGPLANFIVLVNQSA